MWVPLGGSAGDPGEPTVNAKNINSGPLGGDAGGPKVPTINTKNVDGGPQSPCGRSGLHPRSERCVVNLHEYDRQKVTPLMDPIFPALSSVVCYYPWSTYEVWVIQCDTI
jgi:hypothetical protein